MVTRIRGRGACDPAPRCSKGGRSYGVFAPVFSYFVEGRFDSQPAADKDVGVGHGGLDILVTEEFLNGGAS